MKSRWEWFKGVMGYCPKHRPYHIQDVSSGIKRKRQNMFVAIAFTTLIIVGVVLTIPYWVNVREQQIFHSAGEVAIDPETMELDSLLDSFRTSPTGAYLSQKHGVTVNVTTLRFRFKHTIHRQDMDGINLSIAGIVHLGDNNYGQISSVGYETTGYHLVYSYYLGDLLWPTSDISAALTSFVDQGIPWYLDQTLTLHNLTRKALEFYELQIEVTSLEIHSVHYNVLHIIINRPGGVPGTFNATYFTNTSLYQKAYTPPIP